ncbi:MAG: DUF4386 family protein [Anaerolineales bacterium]|nr:DUF4386 family protein [Anaerolineales bacterium]
MVTESTSQTGWKSLYKIGGVAALLAGILFRRNMSVEIEPFIAQAPPETIVEWFTLLQKNSLLALSLLNILDLVNYALLGLAFLALYAALKETDKSLMSIAAASGFAGIVVYFAANTAFSLLALSQQYAAASTEAQKASLEAAGQALLALTRFGTGGHPGAGGYISLLLVALATLLISLTMLKSGLFNQVTAIAGILAGAFDLAFCLVFVLPTGLEVGILAVIFIPAAGLFLMIWHILVGVRLYRLGK